MESANPQPEGMGSQSRTARLLRPAASRRNREIESLPPPSGSYLDGSPNVWEDWQWVAQMLSTLPSALREVFELVLAELDTKEIAGLLGKTPATIRQNLAHARRRLKANLGKDYQIDPARKRRKEDTP